MKCAWEFVYTLHKVVQNGGEGWVGIMSSVQISGCLLIVTGAQGTHFNVWWYQSQFKSQNVSGLQGQNVSLAFSRLAFTIYPFTVNA